MLNNWISPRWSLEGLQPKKQNIEEGWVKKMKQIAQSLDIPDFDQCRKYHRYLEELEEIQMQVLEITQNHEDFKKYINHFLVSVDKKMIEASKALDREKVFLKWSLTARRQVKIYMSRTQH